MNISKNVWYAAAMLLVSTSCKKVEPVTATAEGSLEKNSAEVSAALNIPAKTVPTAAIKHLIISPDYLVEARVTGTSTYYPVPVYKTDNYAEAIGSDRRKQTAASFANFSFTNGTSIDIRITSYQKPITTYKIRPKSYNITSSKTSNNWYVNFTINTNRKVAFINDNDPLNPLFIYGNPPEPAAETASGGTTYTYGPGVHDIGYRKAIHSNDRINIRAGAIVQGTFLLDRGADNIKFLGHGILTSGNIAFQRASADEVKNCTFAGAGDFYSGVSNVTWQGLTIVNAAGWVFGCTIGWNGDTHLSHHNTIKDIKQVHWNAQTDPIWYDGDYNTVTDCFLFANDDITTHGSNFATLSKLVIWQGGNGGHLFMHDNYSSSNTIMHDGIDIIGQDKVANTILLQGKEANNVTIKNVTFKNINIEERNPAEGTFWRNRLIDMNNVGTGSYTVTNFTFDNFRVEGAPKEPADGEGVLAPKGAVTGLKFRNFYFGNTKMWSLGAANITKNANVAAPVFE